MVRTILSAARMDRPTTMKTVQLAKALVLPVEEVALVPMLHAHASTLRILFVGRMAWTIQMNAWLGVKVWEWIAKAPVPARSNASVQKSMHLCAQRLSKHMEISAKQTVTMLRSHVSKSALVKQAVMVLWLAARKIRVMGQHVQLILMQNAEPITVVAAIEISTWMDRLLTARNKMDVSVLHLLTQCAAPIINCMAIHAMQAVQEWKLHAKGSVRAIKNAMVPSTAV